MTIHSWSSNNSLKTAMYFWKVQFSRNMNGYLLAKLFVLGSFSSLRDDLLQKAAWKWVPKNMKFITVHYKSLVEVLPFKWNLIVSINLFRNASLFSQNPLSSLLLYTRLKYSTEKEALELKWECFMTLLIKMVCYSAFNNKSFALR